jgi:hypothetical protein
MMGAVPERCGFFMAKDQSVGGIKKVGRPVGSGHGQQTIVRLRAELTEALNILDRGGKPLSQILAENLEKDAPRTLQAIGRYLPTNVTVEAGDGFLAALQAVGEAIRVERDDDPILIDVSPDNV